MGEGLRVGKRLNLLRMGPGCGCGTGAGVEGMLQGLEVDPGDAGRPRAGVSKPVWPVNCTPGTVCMATCGRP